MGWVSRMVPHVTGWRNGGVRTCGAFRRGLRRGPCTAPAGTPGGVRRGALSAGSRRALALCPRAVALCPGGWRGGRRGSGAVRSRGRVREGRVRGCRRRRRPPTGCRSANGLQADGGLRAGSRLRAYGGWTAGRRRCLGRPPTGRRQCWRNPGVAPPRPCGRPVPWAFREAFREACRRAPRSPTAQAAGGPPGFRPAHLVASWQTLPADLTARRLPCDRPCERPAGRARGRSPRLPGSVHRFLVAGQPVCQHQNTVAEFPEGSGNSATGVVCWVRQRAAPPSALGPE